MAIGRARYHRLSSLLRASLALATNPITLTITCHASNACSLVASHVGVLGCHAAMPEATSVQGQQALGCRGAIQGQLQVRATPRVCASFVLIAAGRFPGQNRVLPAGSSVPLRGEEEEE